MQSVSDNIPLEYEKGAGAYDDMVSGAIANGSNPANIIDKFTFSNYRVDSTDSNLKNLGSIFLLILLVIYSFPIILVKKNPTYKTMLFGVFGAILMGWANWLFLSMNWFISIDVSGGPGYIFIVFAWALSALILLIEALILFFYILWKIKKQKNLNAQAGQL